MALPSIFDFKALERSLQASATSFMSMSFSNLSASNTSSGSFASRVRSRSNPTDLCIDSLQVFISETLVELVEDQEVLDMLQIGVQEYIASVAKNDKGSASALNDIELGILFVLEDNHTLPSSTVADLHSYLGLIFQNRDDNSSAKESFLRALWLRTHTLRASAAQDDDAVRNDLLIDIALTEHRLGVAVGRNGQYLKAIGQIKRAIQSYEHATVGISEGCYCSAREDLHEFQEAYQISLLAKSRITSPIRRPGGLRRCVTVSGDALRSQRVLRRTRSGDSNRRPTWASAFIIPVRQASFSASQKK